MSIVLEQIRLSVTEPDTLLFYGISTEDKDSPEIEATIKEADGREQSLTVSFSKRTNADIRRWLATMQAQATEQLIGQIALPPGWQNAREIRLVQPDGTVLRRIRRSRFKKLQNVRIAYHLDGVRRTESGYELSGWTAAPQMPEIRIFDGSGNRIGVQITRSLRSDVAICYPELPSDLRFGFAAELDLPDRKNTPWRVCFVIPESGEETEVSIDDRRLQLLITHKKTAAERAASLTTKAVLALQDGGLVNVARRIWNRLKISREPSYEEWLEACEVSAKELQRQRTELLSEDITLSVVVPVYRTRPDHLLALIRSLQAQTWPHWELCLADASAGRRADEGNTGGPNAPAETTLAGASAPAAKTAEPDRSAAAAISPLADLLNRESAADPRIRVAYLAENGGISDNTNAAIALASGELIVFADHDDLLAPHALYEIAKAYLEDPTREAIYSDEDKIDMEGEHRFGPHFKSDYNPDLLRSVNYICHIFAVTRKLLDRVGLLRREYDGAQDYDFVLRACEAAKQVYHIPKILYHWRAHPDSTAENPQSKLYAFEAGKRAIQAHYDRTGLPARVTDMEFYGTYRSVYEWKEQPLISILIPNKDHVEDLDRCIRSIREKSTYRNVEIIVIENNSEEAETFAYYEKAEQGMDPRPAFGETADEAEDETDSRPALDVAAPIPVRVVRYTGPFNFSAVNNFGAQYAKGEYLLLLNNDTELIRPESLWELVSVCMREDVGAVGARLYYPDDTIQHAGVILGVGPYGGFAGHCFVNVSRYDVGYMNRLICMCDYSAVTGACLMTPKAVYDEVGGLSEDFVVALNDIDYCLKVGRTGKRVVYNPYAEFYHYESRSRGYDENNKEKEARLIAEVHRFQERWKEILAAGDPMYNRNLSLKRLDWGLKELS